MSPFSAGSCTKHVLKIARNYILLRHISNKFSYEYRKNVLYFAKPLNSFRTDFSNVNCVKNLQNNKNVFRCMAGHAKWQNVLHTKQSKDLQKSKLCDKYNRLVRNAVREGGSDPKINSRLADVISEAHRHNIPNSTLESAMKAAQYTKTKSGTIEIIGPGGCFIVLEYECGNISSTRHDIKQVLKKHGGVIPQGEGRWRACFEQKGLIRVIGKVGEDNLNAEIALDSAIEAGAEDVQTRRDEDDRIYLEFFCAPDDLHPVKKELETMQYKIEEAYVAYIPNVMVELSPQDSEAAGNMINELEDMSDVVRVYENVQ